MTGIDPIPATCKLNWHAVSLTKVHNKIEIAAQMLSEAERLFEDSTRDSEYIGVIVLAGSVLGIVEPLLREKGVKATHDVFVEIADLVSTPGEKPLRHGAFKAVYNSLKHAGDPKRKVKAWEDLEFSADLFEEAEWLLDAARQDLRTLGKNLGQH